MTREALEVSLRNDLKSLHDISKTMEAHGVYKSIPSVLEGIANDISEYLDMNQIMIDTRTPVAVFPDQRLDGKQSILSRIEKMQI